METDEEMCRAKGWRDINGEETEKVIKGAGWM